MKTALRLALFALFAAAGAGLAICVGMSAHVLSQPPKPATAELVAMVRTEDEIIAADRGGRQNHVAAPAHEAASEPSDTDSRSTAPVPPMPTAATPIRFVAPEPRGPVVVEPGLPYAQQAAQQSVNDAMPAVLEFLRKGLAASQTAAAPVTIPAPPPTPTPAAAPVPAPPPVTAEVPSPRGKTTVEGEGDGKLRIQIQDEDIRRVLDALSVQGNLNILASKSVEGKVSATLNGVDIDSALKAILKSTGFVCRRENNFIFVGTPEDFNTIEQGMDRVGTRVYRTNYVTALELKTLVQPLLTEKIGVASISSPTEAGIATNDSAAGGDKFAGSEVLVVRDYEAVLTQVDQMVTEVDVRPLQVSIEAMILSVQLKDEDKFGVNFQFLRQNPNIAFGLGSPAASLASFPLDGGLKFGLLDSNLGAFVTALESVGDTNVIANPRLMVLNKQRAEIQIGDKQGYVNQTITQTASTQSIEFLDTGTQLRLRPFISSDGLIRLEVHPELSDGNVELKGGFTLPNKHLTQVTTNVMVRDGCTVVIGGLIHEQLTETKTQVPFLGDLPLVGFAFRQSDQTTERREVIVLLTPRIVYEPGTCQEGTKTECEYLRRQSTFAEKMSPFGKRSIARRYFRLAETAYAEGDCDKALRFAEMSVQFDPLNREALELRSNIWLGKPLATRGAATMTDAQTAVNPLEGQLMPDSLIDDLEKAPMGPPTPLHPLDPGMPGQHRDLVRPNVLQ